MEERLNSLEVALTNEMREREFYESQSRRTKNPLGKTMFARLAEEEQEHYERLQELSVRWKREERWPETVPLTVKNTNISDILKDFLKKAREIAPADKDDLGAIRTALDFEARGAAFYERLSSEVSDTKEREFFRLLAAIEQEHYASLKDTEEFLTNPAGWYQQREHTGLDGA